MGAPGHRGGAWVGEGYKGTREKGRVGRRGCAPRTRLPMERAALQGQIRGCPRVEVRGRAGRHLACERGGKFGWTLGPRPPCCHLQLLFLGRPTQLGIAPNHYFVLLFCWRAPNMASAMAERSPAGSPLLQATAVSRTPSHSSLSGTFLPRTMCRAPKPGPLPSQGVEGSSGGNHAGDGYRLNIGGVHFP